MSGPMVDIIIPTHNQGSFTVSCLTSVEATCDRQEARIVWVDNGSTLPERLAVEDRLAKMVHPCLRVFAPQNLGFPKATNCGLALSTAPYVLLLNNDTELAPGWLPKLLEVFEKEPTVGIVGPRSSSPHQWQGTVPERPGYQLLGPTAMLSFFCALIRREVIVQCGYLSEMYGVGLGDDDEYCAVAQKHGWRLALRTDLTILHHHRTTFRALYGEGGWLPAQQENIARFKQRWGRR